MSKVIGIDLGTTNSCVAIFESGEPVVITNSEGKRTTPSIVGFTNDEKKVGDAAKRQAVTNPTKTIHSIKRFMGETFDNVGEEIKHVQYSVKPNSSNVPCVDIDGKLYTPQEISALILQKMKKTAEDYLGEEVKDAVITVPAYFNDTQRQSTKDAGTIAGLNVLRIINEPTAASLSFGINKSDKNMKICVFDYGGGTHDVTILEFGDGVFEVLATEGDTHLGGNDIDQCIIDWMIDEFKKDNSNFDLSKDPMAMQRLKEAAERAKIELSSTTTTEINLPYITAIDGVPVHFVKTLSRSVFEKMIDSIVSRTIEPCKSAIKKAGITVNDIDEVLLVGGSTRIPAIQRAVEKFFGKTPNKSLNPDEAVAMGAAIQGAILVGDNSIGDVVLLDVIPLSLGIETIGGVCTKLVEANTTIPTKKTETFSTAMDNQPSVEIVVLQGERPMAKDNKVLGRFHLDGIMPAPKGVPQIEVSFNVDANGILDVSAIDKATGKEQNIRIEANSGLTNDEIERMKKEAEENAEADKREFENISTLNLADSTIFQTEKQMSEMGDKLTEEQKNKLGNDLVALKDAHERKDVDGCKLCMETLQKTWQEIAVTLYGQSNPDGQQVPNNPFKDVFTQQ